MRSRGEIGRKVYENHTLKQMLWVSFKYSSVFFDATVGFFLNGSVVL